MAAVVMAGGHSAAQAPARSCSRAAAALHSSGQHSSTRTSMPRAIILTSPPCPACKACSLWRQPSRAFARPRAQLDVVQQQGQPQTSCIEVRAAVPQDYGAIADLSAAVFHADEGPWQSQFSRFDRMFSLQLDADMQEKGIGRTACLLACQQPTGQSVSAEAGASNTLGPLGVLSRFLQPDVLAGLGASYKAAGLAGVAVADTFGNLIPPRTLDPGRDGAFGWVARQGYVYVSSVMVAPDCRRQGIAERLMAEVEALAAEWDCHSAALHVNPNNTAAVALYAKLGYRDVALEAPWQPFLQGRASGGRCRLMVKRLPKKPSKHAGTTT